jgi:hypothetical protein
MWRAPALLLWLQLSVKMATDGETGKPRVDETNLYLQNHRILELFNNMTSQLIFNRPGKYSIFPSTIYLTRHSHL